VLRENKEVVLAAIEGGCDGVLNRTSAEICEDRKVVFAAVTADGSELEASPLGLSPDPGIVLAAVSNDGCALEFASAKLRDDMSVVAQAFRNNPEALGFASPRIHEYDIFEEDGGVAFEEKKKKGEERVAVGLVGQPRDREAEAEEGRLYEETVIPYW